MTPDSQLYNSMAVPSVDRMMIAFGASLVKSRGNGCEDVWYCKWKIVAVVQSVQYDLPGGTKGHHFVDMSDEVCLLSHRVTKSERLIVFLSVLLQRDATVKSGLDICRFSLDV